MSDLYHVSYRRLVAQVYAFTTDLTEAQDAVQEAFARALARRQALSDIDAPEAWLRTVAINIVRRRWRRKQLLNTILLRERPLTRMVVEPPEPDRADLRDALASLPKSYREVIVLHYLADLPVDEVAAILEVPVGTVKSRLSRGREALKGLLDDVETPPLAQVRQRAGKIRARRQAVKASTALAVLCASVIAFFPSAPTMPPLQPGQTPPSYSAQGITVVGIFDVATVPDLPGKIVEFDVGMLRTDENVWAKSSDQGQTWEIVSHTPATGPRWGGDVWPEALATRTWVAPHPTPAGIWWCTTVSDGGLVEAAYSATPSDNASWKKIPLNAPTGKVVASTRGEQVVVITPGHLFLGDTNGFERKSAGIDIAGEPIMLPDGRIVAASGGRWNVSDDFGASWITAEGNIPAVGELRATSTGYVAFNLFAGGWVATSTDGVTWQKLPVR